MTAAVNHTNTSKTTTPGVDTSATATLASQDVGLLFVREYYTFLNKKPSRLHAFYNKDSYFVRGDEGESVQTYHGQDEIRQNIEELNFEDCKVLVTQVDSQTSANNGIIIQVLGEMCVKDGPSQKFSQTFFLAPQPNGYYVLNDIFRFLKDEVDIDYYTCEDDQQQQPAAATATTKKDETVVVEQQQQQIESVPAKEQQRATVPVQQVDKTSVPVEEKKPVNQQPSGDDGEPKSDEKKKKTVNGGGAPDVKKSKQQQQANKHVEKTAESPPPAPATPRSWANLAANDSSKWGAQVSEAKGSVAATPPPATTTTTAAAATQQQQQQPSAKESAAQPQSNKEQQPRKDEVTSIFVKNVTGVVTEEHLLEAFTKFGPVKSMNIVHTRNCAFLDFTTPEACQKALSQNKVSLSTGMVVLAEERRRFPSGGSKQQQQQQQQQNGNYERRPNSFRRGGGGGGRNAPSGTNKARPNAGNTQK